MKNSALPPIFINGEEITERERGLIYWLLKGLFQKEFADKLGITLSTVKGEFRFLYSKVKIKTGKLLVAHINQHPALKKVILSRRPKPRSKEKTSSSEN